MSPEILLGIDFSLPSDIFSFGIILLEFSSLVLVDSTHYKRQIPSFGIDADEAWELASPGCPSAFVQLALDCVSEEPTERPGMREIVHRLRLIEGEVIRNELESAKAKVGGSRLCAVGSVRGSSLAAVLGSHPSKLKKGTTEPAADARPGMSPRMPSFSGQVDVSAYRRNHRPQRSNSENSSGSSEDGEIEETIKALEQIGIDPEGRMISDEPAPVSMFTSALSNITVGATTASKVPDSPGAAARQLSNTLRKNSGAGITLQQTIKAGSTFKVSGHGNPWWADEADRETLPDVNTSWLEKDKRKKPISVQPPMRTSSIVTVTNKAAKAAEEEPVSPSSEENYSTSVVRTSKIGPAHAPLSSTLSIVVARQENGAVTEVKNEDVGSAITLKQGKAAKETDAVSPSAEAKQGESNGELSQRASYMSARNVHAGHAHEPSFANATIASSRHGGSKHSHASPASSRRQSKLLSTPETEEPAPAPLFHRFTLVKNGMKRPSNMTAAANAAASGLAGSAFGSLLPPAIMLSNALAKCWVCGKRIGWKPFLDCDDCPYK